MESVLFGIAFGAYTVAMSLYLAYALTRRAHVARGAFFILILAVVMHVASLLVRTFYARQLPDHGGYVPWSNWFESFSFLCAVIAVEYLAIQSTLKVPILGAFIVPLAWTMLVVAVHSSFGRRIPDLPAALQSQWMAAHVPVMFAAYAAFANAFGLGLAYVLEERQIKAHRPSHLSFQLPALDDLDRLIYRVIFFAFLLLTVGLYLGAQWAHEVWGRYWGWDAKETWALITWIVYAFYLYMRHVSGWRGRKTAYFSLAGFAVVIFTYVGVNYLSSLHGFLSAAGR